ncbi:MAG: hypothetical protein KatS3mg057_0978 [Herpetosiphonaceae bacterium]|nr:MAG: hypothetical protein KatS3mg057_0978 [Herpetosiphonaceae bacterium]
MAPGRFDIDILLYNEIQLVSNELTIPHPRIAERSFVLVPLIEIDPNLRLVPGGPSVADLLSTLPDRESPQRVEALSLL